MHDFVIYFDNRRFVITPKVKKYFDGDGMGLFMGNPTHQDFPKILEIFQSHPVIQNVFIGDGDVNRQFEQFASNFTVLDAAGGLVVNAKGEFLLIYRRGKWDLPKGKVEVGESNENAALREVMEETGLSELMLGRHIITTYHTYELNEKPILKRTYWYAMNSVKCEPFVPQSEEDITSAEWVDAHHLSDYLDNSFSNIRDVFREYLGV